MNDDDFRKSAREVLEESVATLDFLIALTERIEQAIHGAGELRRIRIARNAQATPDRCILDASSISRFKVAVRRVGPPVAATTRRSQRWPNGQRKQKQPAQ